MKVESIKQFRYNTLNNSVSNTPSDYTSNSIDVNHAGLPAVYPAVYFTGKKITDIDEGKNKLLRRFNEILKEDAPEEEINQTELQYKGLKVMMHIKTQLESLYSESQALWENKFLNPQQKYNRAMQIKKEVNSLKSVYDRGFLYIVKSNNYVADEKTDYVLVNKFKSSVENDNFNLKKVFTDYYKPMNDIQSLKELKKNFPKIQTPKKPEEVIAQKLENTITREFYEDLDNAFEAKDKKKVQELLYSKVMQLFNDNIKIKSQEEKDRVYKKLAGPTIKAITVRYHKLHNNNSISSVPKFKKQNKNILSENDYQLIKMNNYEDFVLTVLKEQYTNFKNPNDIVYSKNGTNIKVSSIKDSDYKFEKIPSRIIKLVADAQKVRTSQRDYKNYSKEHFKKKLAFYAEKFDQSETLLNSIVQFDSCLFEKEDIEMLIRFLQGADKVWDGDLSLKEFEREVYYNGIKPTHTERINALEQKKKLDAIKAENKKLANLHLIQENFDSRINTLYENNLNYIAGLCLKYKPESLDEKQIEIANIIIGVIDKNTVGQNIKNKEKIENQVVRITNYLNYSLTTQNNPVLKDAQDYAKNKNGIVDMEKAGKYLLNSEFIQNFPNSLELASNKEIARKIAQKKKKKKAVEQLCEYDDYRDLAPNEKAKISNILKIFDMKDSIEKSVIKIIVEEDYINSDTHAVAKVTDDGSKKAKTAMGKNAKSQIYDHYKFPKCLIYYDAFEDALTKFAVNKNSAGIKKVVGTSDANELKIKGHDDRLFAYNNSYYFDEFSLNGLH